MKKPGAGTRSRPCAHQVCDHGFHYCQLAIDRQRAINARNDDVKYGGVVTYIDTRCAKKRGCGYTPCADDAKGASERTSGPTGSPGRVDDARKGTEGAKRRPGRPAGSRNGERNSTYLRRIFVSNDHADRVARAARERGVSQRLLIETMIDHYLASPATTRMMSRVNEAIQTCIRDVVREMAEKAATHGDAPVPTGTTRQTDSRTRNKQARGEQK